MYSVAMEGFLSKENIKMHTCYLNELKLKCSILEKSCPDLIGKDLSEIKSLRISRDLKESALKIKFQIMAHEIYFSSFAENVGRCDFLKKYYSSKESFLYELFVSAKYCETEFLFIYAEKNGRPVIADGGKRLVERPVLALDLCEHSYFSDYAFNKDEYIKRAVNSLDLSKLEIR